MQTEKERMDKLLKNAETGFDSIPKVANRGKTKIDYTPVINLIKEKGIVRFSEKHISINSVVKGLKRTSEEMKYPIATNTRKVNGVVYLYVTKAKPKTK